MLESIPGKVFVVGVVCLICFIAYSSQLCIFIPVYETSESILLLVPFNILVLFVFYNYYLAVTTDPGKIPTNWLQKALQVQDIAKHAGRINLLGVIIADTFDAEPNTFVIVFMVANFVLAFVVLFAVGILSGYQFYCLLRNQTNIEAWERGKVETLIRRGKILPVNYPFDIGIYKNICQVLGPNPLLWLWPQRAVGDGLSFPVVSGTDPRLPYYWPPRDPDDLRPSIFSSKYKRQQEARRLQAENPDANVDDESEGYYDSGSFISDSDEYDEEVGMKNLTGFYDISATSPAHEHSDEERPLAYFARKPHGSPVEKKQD
ncbi:hypothetical protein G6F70_008178 [Rhizopus microsporus]|nr:hypothetical protein G6F71_008193 [Rhizopus microsporus]KAG1195507.1 hypothetical protein G6F70_008178 [Rhizopus microsporus]KAG1207328.1 hypothetical protein G6F69_008134 [Rhizopus microsporus]KAG1228177.1 hypothetical protein G6F67_007992 [Rhizopus microsporus]KAG1259988.1 hypothetical protein G6F68_007746 [Rhizopus microsporus]